MDTRETRCFDGRHVVVTGGAGALGRDVVQLLLDAGATCHIPDLSDAQADVPWKENARISVTHGVDLTDETAVERFYSSIPVSRGLWGSIHIAGGFGMSPLVDVSKTAFVSMMQLNVLTCVLCCKHATIAMQRTGNGGRIVNVGARPGLFPELGAGMVAYTTSKAAVCALTQALGAELASDNILVNAVIPSIMDTPSNRRSMPDADYEKWPSTMDVARTMVFLASPENRVTRSALVSVYGQS